MRTPILQAIYFMIALMLFTTINIQANNNPPPITLHVAEAGSLPSMIAESRKIK